MPATKRNKIKVKRVIALCLLFIFLNQTFAPTIAYALTAGPTAPEATNFEPIDTTDMVNPLSGSFTYSLPLLEVPGPEGSYPLALSYHAGIQLNEEASWVGLGWSLNPGAISRNVNGYPDDWNNVAGTERDYWAGGTTTTESISLNIGIGSSPASVNFGLSFSEDTYKGFGIGGDISIGAEGVFSKGSPFGYGINIGVSSSGGSYASAGLSAGHNIGTSGLSMSGTIGINTNFKSISGYASAGLHYSYLGASIKTNGAVSVSVAGISATSVNNANAGKISTSSSGFSIPIPLYFGVSLSLGYSQERYWSDETTGFMANGVLHSRTSINSTTDLNQGGDDNYSLLDPNISIIDNPDPVKQLGGTYPNFDNYSVTAQGLGGNMRPYIFSAILYNQNAINNQNHSTDVYGEKLSTNSNPNTHWQFRFINDMSNSYRQQHPWTADQTYNFDGNPQHGNGDDPYGYDPATNRLEGSSHIEYFTNDEIADPNPTSKANSRGFIHCPETGGFTRKTTTNWNAQLGSQIGGFMITNNSGVTYHYALPAYSYNELVHSEQINTPTSYNQLNKPARYAYTWYLTAITGPDYVNRGTPGLINVNDWGYWVKFDYGQWTDSYGWRNPSEGYQKDLDNTFQSFSMGQKELYYLDAIETRSHTAIFEKEMRFDGKSNTGATLSTVESPGIYTTRNISYCNVAMYNSDGGLTSDDPTGTRQITPRTTMRLDNIYIYSNDQLPADINTIRQSSTNYNITKNYTATSTNCDGGESPTYTDVISEGQNVIDINDIAALNSGNAFTSKCLRKIAFNYNYSISPGVTNSYDPANPTVLTGKLTLLSVDFQGRGGTPMTPPTQFQYDLDPTDPKNSGIVSISAVNNDTGNTGTVQFSSATSANFSVGDIIRFTSSSTPYYCVLTSSADGITYTVHFIGSAPSGTPSNLSAMKTKNPPYHPNPYDNWGMYKVDYYSSPSGNENLSRFTTALSNKSTDVWSLHKIQSGIGADININYEGNTYNKSVLNKNRSLVLTSFTRNSAGNYTFSVNNESIDLTKIYQQGDNIDLIVEKWENDANEFNTKPFTALNSDSYQSRATIQTVNNSNTLTVTVDPKMDHDISTSTYVHTQIVAGNISANGGNLFYGGGIRVKSIITDDLTGDKKMTAYSYGALGHQNDPTSSSGVTTFEPLVFDQIAFFNYPSLALRSDLVAASDLSKPVLQREVYKNMNKLLAISRELPPPGVMYEYVTTSDYNILRDGTAVPTNGSIVNQYEVFKPEMIGIYDYSDLHGLQSDSGNGPLNSASLTSTLTGQAKKDRSIKDYTSRVGNLKRTITYDNLGNKLTEKINHYLYDDLDNTSFQNQMSNYESRLGSYNNVNYNNMGVILERYGNARFVVNSVTTSGFIPVVNYAGTSFLMMSNKETYPSIQTGTTQIDYKNGTRMDQSNLAYDFYTGAVTKTLTTDSYGNRFINEVTPAYMAGNKGAYPALGLKTFDDDPGNVNYSGQHKQMLTQQASNYTFSVDASNNKIGVVTASIQTWSNSVPVLDPDGNTTATGQSNIWRMEKSISWMPVGTSANNLTPYASFADYFASGGSSNPAWQKPTATITRYNVYSAALEATDVNNNYGATRMGYNNSKVLVSGSTTKYNEIAYAGAEDAVLSNGNFSNGISPGDGVVTTDTTKAHTGTNSLLVASHLQGFSYTVPIGSLSTNGGNYSVSVWAYSSPTGNVANSQLYYTVNGITTTPVQSYSKVAKGWYLLEMTVPGTAITGTGNLIVGCRNGSAKALYFDDFRFQPTTASSTAYVYDNQTGELTYILDNNNLYTRYQYDAIGRLVRVYKEVIGKTKAPLIKGISYNYGKFTL